MIGYFRLKLFIIALGESGCIIVPFSSVIDPYSSFTSVLPHSCIGLIVELTLRKLSATSVTAYLKELDVAMST